MDSIQTIIPTVDEKSSQPWPVWVRAVLTSSCIALLLFAVISCFALKWGSYSLAWAYLGGTRVAITPGIVYLKTPDFEKEFHPVKFTVINMSDKPIRVVGQRVSCGCISYSDLPVEILSEESHQFEALVTLTGRDPEKPFREQVWFITNYSRGNILTVTLQNRR